MKGKQGYKTVRNCTQPGIDKLLAPYLKNKVPLEEARMLEDHLAGCNQCQKKIGVIMMIQACGLHGHKQGYGVKANVSANGRGNVIKSPR